MRATGPNKKPMKMPPIFERLQKKNERRCQYCHDDMPGEPKGAPAILIATGVYIAILTMFCMVSEWVLIFSSAIRAKTGNSPTWLAQR
jgi:hypothetical protein